MTLRHRVTKLELGAGFGLAPPACAVYEEGEPPMAYLWATEERLPLDEYDRRWPGHPTLKAYLGWFVIDGLGDAWPDAPPPRSSADR